MKRSVVDGIVKQVAIEHSRQPSAGACLCSHINLVHREGWGPCDGRVKGRRCDCQRFQGVNWGRVQQFRVFARALLATLKQAQKKK